MKTQGLPWVDVQKELNRVPCWILLATYTNVCWSIHLSSMITQPLLITIYILHKLSHAIYIPLVLYSWMLSMRLRNVWEIVFFSGTIL